MPVINTFRDRTLSLFQSALDEVSTPAAPHAAAVGTALATALQEDFPLSEPPDLQSLPAFRALPDATLATLSGPVNSAWQCTRLAFQMALASAHNDQITIQRLHDEIKDSSCDPGWITKTVNTFLGYYVINKGQIPYRPGLDNVLPDLPARATIAVIGDWGTGTESAGKLLDQAVLARPDVLLHLGDIYYSGTRAECGRFLKAVRPLLDQGIRVYTLAGNHDMYSGGIGYYQLIDQLKQNASYFCLGNDDWQFLAMDTGRDDFNPFLVDSHAPVLAPGERDWHLAKIRQAGKRKTVLLSHHPLFTAFEPIAHQAVNDGLQKDLGEILGNVALWLWGHEHRLDIYGPYLGLKRGRCLGASAVPVFVDKDYFTRKFTNVPLLEFPANSGKTVQLGNDGRVYNHAYAIIKLDGPSAKVSYYEYDGNQSRELFAEELS